MDISSKEIREMSLFSGIGGGILGGKLSGFRTVCYVEWGKHCQQILSQRFKDGIFDDAPVWDDIRTFDGKGWCGLVDVVTAGFPCQTFSFAGKRVGKGSDKNMWPDTVRVIGEVKPEWCLLENVPGLLSSGYFGEVLSGLAEVGYDTRWGCLSASSFGAPHRRERLWIVCRRVGS